MKIILSPAKKMNRCEPLVNFGDELFDSLVMTKPVFLERAETIRDWLSCKTVEERKALWNCNEKIAFQNVERLETMCLDGLLTPAVLAYDGIAFSYMAPSVFETGQFTYVQENLRILSAFYGVVKALDGITPYRLETQAKGSPKGYKNLYEFWGRSIYEEVRDDSGIIINLASKEYYKCVEKYLTSDDRFITCSFVEFDGKKYITKGTYAKMARGEMVRFMAENRINKPEEIKNFNRLGYGFREDLSSENEYVFERKNDK